MNGNVKQDLSEILGAFSLGVIQDALNLMQVMDKHKVSRNEVSEYVKTTVPPMSAPQPTRMRKVSRKQREREFRLTQWGRRRR